jgi:hypothetical protein
MDLDRRVFVVIQSGPLQLPITQLKTQGPDQVEPATGIGAEPDHVSGVGWNFRLEQDDFEHFLLQFTELGSLIMKFNKLQHKLQVNSKEKVKILITGDGQTGKNSTR